MGLTQNLGRLSPSIFSDASLNIGVGAAPSGSYKFEVTGTSKVSGVLTLGATLSNGTYTYTLPAATGTLALVGGAGVGTVTSVAALTLGTSGTDLSSSVANSTTTPVITLNVPTASAANRGALSSADWTTFNSKQGTITLTTTGTSGAATFSSNTLNIPNYTITNAVTGTGTTNYLPKFTGASTIGNSVIQEASNNIGIGHSPSYKFDINNVGGASATARLYGNDQANVRLRLENTGGRIWELTGGLTGANNSTFTIYDATASATRLQIDASGNLGLGVTPSAWNSIYKVAEIGTAAIWGSSSYNNAAFSTNIFYNAGNSPRYIASDYSNMYIQDDGQHSWYNAPSGTAGNAITFTQAMTLDASGSLLIGASGTFGVKYISITPSSTITPTVIQGAHAGVGAYAIAMQSGGGNVLIGTTTDDTYKLDVNGTGRFSGDVTIKNASTSANLFIDAAASGGSEAGLYFKNGGTNKWENYTANNDTALNWYSYANSTIVFKLASTGAATFSSSATFGSYVSVGNTGSLTKLNVNNAVSGAILPYIQGTGLSYNSEGISVAGSNTNNTNIGNGITFYNNVASVGAYGPVVSWSSMTVGGAYNATYAFITGVYRGAGGDNNWAVGDLIFGTGNSYGASERMRITSGGNVGIGMSSPANLLSLKANTTAPILDITRSGGGQGKNSGILFRDQANNEVGAIGTEGQVTNDLQILSIAGIRLYTSSDLISTNERMRITSGGQVQISQAGYTFSYGLKILNWGFVEGGDAKLYVGYSGSGVGNFNNSTGVYTATSDINKKKDFEESTIGLNAVLGLKPTLYRMKTDEETSDKHLGFIAQEVKDFIPQAYSESINGEDTFIGLTEMPIIAALTKAIQEQQLQIEELKQLVATK